MKIQKINNNKALIIITSDELKKSKITLKDIKEGKENVQNFLFDILENSKMLEDFHIYNSQLLVEVSSTNSNMFMITITKVDNIADFNTIDKFKHTKSIIYTVSSNLYEFNNLLDLYKFAIKALQEKLYLGTNTLYMFNNKYYLLFSNQSIKNPTFIKTFSVMSEYSCKYYSKKIISFNEYATPLLKRNALQHLQKI